jgi:Domain of unknown function (DUF4349)
MKRLIFILLVLSIVSCDQGQRLMVSKEMSSRGNAGLANDMALFREANFNESINRRSQSPAPITTDRKLIKNGSIEFEVSDTEETQKAIVKLTADAGGYVSSESQNSYSGSPRYEQTVRVPAEKLDEFLAKIEGLAKKVDNKSINTQDVTEEFIDVETRLKTKKELEARYRELLKQANKVEDILAIETQLGNVRSEIESMEGRLTYLKNQVSFSTLTITFYKVVSGNYGFGYRFMNSFGNGWNSLLEFVIGIFEAWPFVIMLGLGVWLFVRWRRNRKLANG